MIPYSQLGSGTRVDLVQSIPLDRPLSMYIEPTNICNLKCSFCPHSLDDYAEQAGYHQHMPIELFRKVMDEVRELEIKSIRLFFFGEPVIHPDIEEICRLASKIAPATQVTSNGMLITPRRAQALIDSGLPYLRISAYQDIPHPERVIENLRVLRQLRDSQGKTTPFICAKLFTREEWLAVKDDWQGVADEVIYEGFHTIGSDFVQVSTTHGERKACPFVFYNLVVKSNGDVVPCCVAWEKSLVLGNANESSLREIWMGDKLKEIQRMHLAGRRNELPACAKCDTLLWSKDDVDSLSVEEYDRRRG